MVAHRPLFALLLTALLVLVPGSSLAQKDDKPDDGQRFDVVQPELPVYGERIISYLSDVIIARDGSFEVTETIRVNAEGNRIQRGIYRDFPTRYNNNGRRVRVGFEVRGVERDGQAERWRTENVGNGVRIWIGDENVMLPRGQHSYVIRFHTTRQLGFFEGYDEIYWNVTGNGWLFPIDMAEARIHLPSARPFGQRSIYTGPAGSTDSYGEVVSERPGEIHFRTTRALGPEEGFTIAVAFPKGVVDPPPPRSTSSLWLEAYGPIWAGIAALAA
ncbi:MAG TPA: DUF2207 domain-containing protein, partial [Allosphingosinicella sp.]|nr:DUF2207 domain-containing protein [Allosphingosinicella sp.]